MPVTIVCPNCTTLVQFQHSPLSACPSCGVTLPEPMRQAIAAGVARDSAQRPALLTVGMVGSLIAGGLSSLFLLLAPFDIGTYTFDGEPISGPEFLRRLGLLWTAHCVLLLGIGYALLSGKSWSRTFMMLHWMLMIAGLIALGWREPAGMLACSVVTLLFPLSIAAWYLYAKENVVRYYDALRRIEEEIAARAEWRRQP